MRVAGQNQPPLTLRVNPSARRRSASAPATPQGPAPRRQGAALRPSRRRQRGRRRPGSLLVRPRRRDPPRRALAGADARLDPHRRDGGRCICPIRGAKSAQIRFAVKPAGDTRTVDPLPILNNWNLLQAALHPQGANASGGLLGATAGDVFLLTTSQLQHAVLSDPGITSTRAVVRTSPRARSTRVCWPCWPSCRAAG